jgi:hypothetical protein
MKKLLVIFFLSLVWLGFVSAETIRTEILIDWINGHRFEISESDADLRIEVLNRSDNEEVDREIDVDDVNSSNYNDWDRIVRLDFDTELTHTCSSSQLSNITYTVDKLIDQCHNYQNYLNGTLNNLGEALPWQAEAARLKEEVRQLEGQRDTAQSNWNTTQKKLDGCTTDKQNYYDDWKGADSDYATCTTELKAAKDSFGSKYLIGAVIAAVIVYLFTRKEEKVAEESEEFEEVEY